MDTLKIWRDQLILWSPPRVDSPQPQGTEDAWAKRAKWFGRMAAQSQISDNPLLSRIARIANRRSVILDIGAGAGRLAIPLAERVRRVLAVESSPSMRRALEERIMERKIDNVELIAGRWPDVQAPQVDIAFSANVVYDVADLGPFVLKMDQVADRGCFIELTPRHPLDALRDLWEEFLGWTPPNGPTYTDAVACLQQLGIKPQVEVVKSESGFRFRDLDQATAFYRDRLGLTEGSGVEESLQKRLATKGIEKDGEWVSGWRFEETVILSWARIPAL
jgi:SAM-dependent methyltransferase